MLLNPVLPDGYYWARAEDGGQPYVVQRDLGGWFQAGRAGSLEDFDVRLVICAVKPPVH